MLASDRRLSPRLARARAWLPPALLILALSALFVFGGDRSYFYRSTVHNQNSGKNLALAENLSPRHNFRLFRADIIADDGSRRYVMYSRFPIGGTALIKLAIAPFDSLFAKLLAARTLALLMFCGAVVFAYLAVARLTASRWIGLAAALIAFSSYYALYYSDEVSNESAMDIFGVMMTFHGMVIFVQDGRFRQLLIKACAALLVGWHVYAILLAFIAFGLAREIAAWLRGRPDSGGSPHMRNIHEITGEGRKCHKSIFAALIRSRYTILGAATLLFGIAVLGASLVNEYYAYGGETAAADLPSLRSALGRVSASESSVRERLNWSVFARLQLFRAGGVSLPYALPWKYGYPEPKALPLPGVAVGVLALGAALVGVALARRRRALWATLALYGFFWALFVRDNAADFWSSFEALIYIGVPLALIGLALAGARRIWGERAPVAAALAAVAVFAISAFQIQDSELLGDAPEIRKAEMAELDAMREKTRGKVVAVSEDAYRPTYNIIDYYLAGSVLAKGERGLAKGDPTFAQMARADFVLSRRRDYGGEGFAPLTPENRELFLHAVNLSPTELYRAERRRIESAAPAARSDFDLYLDGDALYYVKSPCTPDDTRGRFLLSVHPVDVADLSEARRAVGHDSLNFDFVHRGTPIFDGACMAKAALPDYEIRLIETGRWIPDGEEVWRAEIRPPLSAKSVARYETAYAETAAGGVPLMESDFDVYMEGGALTYQKSPCDWEDARNRFFLSVRPVNRADLPANRRELGHDALNFDFSPHGIIFADKCMIRRKLPGYEIAAISTGQYIPDAGEIWRAETRLPPSAESIAYYESVYQAAKSSGEPIIRSDFDVYMDAHALTYLKEPCGESDTRGDFFLDIRPANPADLAEYRRERGIDDLAFDFSRSGIIFANKCMARREIPGYAIAEISTGRRVPNEGDMWRAEIRLPPSAKTAARYESAYQDAKASGDPIIRSDFDVYKEGDTLTYLKAPCAESDTRGRFFLSVHPVDVSDLPEERRALGHASLNFDFSPDGIIFADKCMIRRELPDYPILKIETGQWVPGGESLWRGAAAVGD